MFTQTKHQHQTSTVTKEKTTTTTTPTLTKERRVKNRLTNPSFIPNVVDTTFITVNTRLQKRFWTLHTYVYLGAVPGI